MAKPELRRYTASIPTVCKNTAKLLDPWQPQEGIEVLIDRFDKTQVYAFFARDQINNKTLITYFLIAIKKHLLCPIGAIGSYSGLEWFNTICTN